MEMACYSTLMKWIARRANKRVDETLDRATIIESETPTAVIHKVVGDAMIARKIEEGALGLARDHQGDIETITGATNSAKHLATGIGNEVTTETDGDSLSMDGQFVFSFLHYLLLLFISRRETVMQPVTEWAGMQIFVNAVVTYIVYFPIHISVSLFCQVLVY
jgi:hypothetical protein